MPQIEFKETLPYSAQDLYDTVMDIERYPEIFDFIEAVRVRDAGEGLKKADLVIRTPIMNFGYSCDILFSAPDSIDINATNGPFKAMSGKWRFKPCPDGQTEVSYQMHYELGFGLMNAMAKRFIENQVERTRKDLLTYVRQTLKPVNSAAGFQPLNP